MEAAADLITKCVRVRTGISAQYLYRGLYAAQLQRCLRGGVVSSDIVVVDQDVLRRDPQRALDAVSPKLPRHTYEDLSDASLKAEMERRWPDFEKNGWRLDAAYTAPMPEASGATWRASSRRTTSCCSTSSGGASTGPRARSCCCVLRLCYVAKRRRSRRGAA